MQRLAKYIAYVALFVVSFLVFLYWVFPYGSLKERLISGIERQLGGNIEVSAGELEPYWITGVEVKKLEFNTRDASGKAVPAFTLNRLRVRAALFSLLIGSPRVSYLVEAGEGEIAGFARQTEEGVEVDADIDNFDVATFKMLASKLGIKLSGKIDGFISLKINQRRPATSSGKIEIDLKDVKLAESQAMIGPMELPIPALTLTKGKGSTIEIEMSKGTLQVKKLLFKGGDLGLDLSGKIFMSNTIPNSRFNLRGSFSASEAFGQAIPFLFMVEKQKQADGTYPLSITGRISSPTVKVGTFTLPL